jgi:hypothetical protein
MSRSFLKNKRIRESLHIKGRNKHKQDEMPKNRTSKYITLRVTHSMVQWLSEGGGWHRGHKTRKGGRQMVAGIVRQKIKEEIREQIHEQLNI